MCSDFLENFDELLLPYLAEVRGPVNDNKDVKFPLKIEWNLNSKNSHQIQSISLESSMKWDLIFFNTVNMYKRQQRRRHLHLHRPRSRTPCELIFEQKFTNQKILMGSRIHTFLLIAYQRVSNPVSFANAHRRMKIRIYSWAISFGSIHVLRDFGLTEGCLWPVLK